MGGWWSGVRGKQAAVTHTGSRSDIGTHTSRPSPKGRAARNSSTVMPTNMMANAAKLPAEAMKDRRRATSGVSRWCSTSSGASQNAMVSSHVAGIPPISRASSSCSPMAAVIGEPALTPPGRPKPAPAASRKASVYTAIDSTRYTVPSSRKGGTRSADRQANRSLMRGSWPDGTRPAATAKPAIRTGVEMAARNWPSIGISPSTSWMTKNSTPITTQLAG